MALALNLGCHDIHLSGFINVDLDPDMQPDLLWDCTRLLEKFAPGTVDCINAGHFLEHLDVATGRKVVQDVYMLLREYGVFIATCPDYTKVDGNTTEEKERIILAEGTHKALMDGPRMLSYFRDAGFSTATVTEPDKIGLCPFPGEAWQTCVIGVKHPEVKFYTPGQQP